MSGGSPVYNIPEDSDGERDREPDAPVVSFGICRRSLTRYHNAFTISCTAEIHSPLISSNPLAALIPLLLDARMVLYTELVDSIPGFALDNVHHMNLRAYHHPVFPAAMPLHIRSHRIEEDLTPHISIRLAGFRDSGREFNIHNPITVFLDLVFA